MDYGCADRWVGLQAIGARFTRRLARLAYEDLGPMAGLVSEVMLLPGGEETRTLGCGQAFTKVWVLEVRLTPIPQPVPPSSLSRAHRGE